MKKLSLITLLTFMISMLSFQSMAQNISTVIINGYDFNGSYIEIETIKPDYSVEKKEFYKRDNVNFYVQIKRELDNWINEGYYIDKTNSNGDYSTDFSYTIILIKKEEQ